MVQIIIHINKNFTTLFWQSGHSASSGSMEWQTSYKSQFWQSGVQISPFSFLALFCFVSWVLNAFQ